MAVAALAAIGAGGAKPAKNIGDRLELFADGWLLDQCTGDARLKLHQPSPAGVVLRMNHPWEGRYSTYVTVLQDGDRHLMYYRGRADLPPPGDPVTIDEDTRYQVTCFAESRDGIVWNKPNLGLFEVRGTRDNNVVLANHPACSNFTPFLDTQPGVPPEECFKALGGVHARGLDLFVSGDGIHWKHQRRLGGLTGAFDSQNVAFWSEHEQCYVLYFRTWSSGVAYQGRREISRSTSTDLVQWTAPVRMSYGDAPFEELYTQQTQPYFRAPHLYVAFPNRFLPDRRVLSEDEFAAADIWPRSRTNGVNDGVFMTSRGGSVYDRTFSSVFVRPGPDRRNWSPRNNYAAHGILQTGPTELSLYYTRHYAQPGNHLERFVIRVDGFASLSAGGPGGEALTRTVEFDGSHLVLNFATSAAGSVRVALCDATGQPLEGYTFEDCDPLIGDELDRVVTWKGRRALGEHAGRPIRLRFSLMDADVYSLRFQRSEPLR